MDNSSGVGFIAVFAVSGSIALLCHQVHKRLFSDFMKNIESELGGILKKIHRNKKCVRFANDVTEPSSKNKRYRKRHKQVHERKVSTILLKEHGCNKLEDSMPPNRLALYKGILEYKALMGQNVC